MLKPTQVKPNAMLNVHFAQHQRTGYFVKRIPADSGRPAINYVRFPDFAGIRGEDDDGTCEMSDYFLSRRGEYA